MMSLSGHALAVAVLAATLGCSGSTPSQSEAAAPPPPSARDKAPVSASAPADASARDDLSTESTGIKECDEVLNQVRSCFAREYGKPAAAARKEDFERYRAMIVKIQQATSFHDGGGVDPRTTDTLRTRCRKDVADFTTAHPECN